MGTSAWVDQSVSVASPASACASRKDGRWVGKIGRDQMTWMFGFCAHGDMQPQYKSGWRYKVDLCFGKIQIVATCGLIQSKTKRDFSFRCTRIGLGDNEIWLVNNRRMDRRLYLEIFVEWQLLVVWVQGGNWG